MKVHVESEDEEETDESEEDDYDDFEEEDSEDSDQEDDDGLSDVHWRILLAKDNTNDLFEKNFKDIKRRSGRRLDQLYNQIAEDFKAERKYYRDKKGSHKK